MESTSLDSDTYLDRTELHRYKLPTSKHGLRKIEDAGHLTPIRSTGRRTVYRQSQVLAYLEHLEREGRERVKLRVAKKAGA